MGSSELGAYMEKLFPSTDPLRQQIAELRRRQAIDVPEPPPRPSEPIEVESARPRKVVTGARPPDPIQSPNGRSRRAVTWVGVALIASAAVVVSVWKPWARPALLVATSSSSARASLELERARGELGMGKLDAARERLEGLVTADPNDVRAHLLLGKVLSKQHHGQRAEAELRSAIRLAPKNPEPLQLLAELKVAEGELPDAVKLLSEAHRLAPNDAAMALELGGLYGRVGDWKRSAAILDGCLIRDGRDAGGWADLGFARYQLGDDGRAAAALGRALKLDPNLGRAWYYQGFVEYRRGQVEKAIESYRTASQKDPQSTAPLLALGQLYRERHEPLLAERAFHEALGRDPTCESAKAALATPSR
ncbi:MAG: tetratricopeptide repeat protein [Deltaproteobacteria bacterium]